MEKGDIGRLFVSENSFILLSRQTALLEQTLKRKINLQFLTVQPISEAALKQFLHIFREDSFKLRFLQRNPLLSFAIFDSGKIILELSSIEDKSEIKALISENSSLVETYLELL